MTIQPLAVRAHPVKRYLIALLTTAAVYFCYLLAVTPFIDGQVAQVQEASQVPIGPPLPVDDKTEIAKYLPAGSWELQPCKSLDTAFCLLSKRSGRHLGRLPFYNGPEAAQSSAGQAAGTTTDSAN